MEVSPEGCRRADRGDSPQQPGPHRSRSADERMSQACRWPERSPSNCCCAAVRSAYRGAGCGVRQRSGEEFLDRSAGAGPGGVPDDAGQARFERLAHGGRARAGRQGAQGALDVAVKVALAVVGDAIERAAGSCGECRDSPADQAGADRGFVQSGEADERGGRGPPHQRVFGIQMWGDVLSRGRRSDEAGGEQRGGGGDRVLLVFSKGEETGVGRWWRTRKARSAGRRSGSADSGHHHRAGPEGRGVRPEQRRTTGAQTIWSQASYRPPASPSAPAAARARRYPSRRPTAPRTRAGTPPARPPPRPHAVRPRRCR